MNPGSTECNQPTSEFSKTVKLQVAVLRACGLKAAARLAASVASDSELEYCAGVGVNSYVVVKPSFLPQDVRFSHKVLIFYVDVPGQMCRCFNELK